MSALKDFLLMTEPGAVRKSILELFFFYEKNLESSMLERHHELTEDIQFLIRFLDKMEEGPGT